jgi:hypothetical protein
LLGLDTVLFTLRESPPEADKPRIPHLLRSQGFAVNTYSFTLDALDLPDNPGSSSGILGFCNVGIGYSAQAQRIEINDKGQQFFCKR